MERVIECDSGCRYVKIEDSTILRTNGSLMVRSGPAHAVYFATYEVVKQAMGGNASGHHPLAAGKQTEAFVANTL